MKIYNFLPLLIENLMQWKEKPTKEKFYQDYLNPLTQKVDLIFDFYKGDLYSVLETVDWEEYRTQALRLDPAAEERRLNHCITKVQNLFGFPLKGEALLFGAFSLMDGYARFDKGAHTVYLGVDEGHIRGSYLDVLIVHELTHVARESQAAVWTGWGLDPQMPHDDFTEKQPVLEHLMGEGFSCAVSEILVPGMNRWDYTYQSEKSLNLILRKARSLDKIIHKEIIKSDGDYTSFYWLKNFGDKIPSFCHYVWAWQWAKKVLKEKADSDPKKLVGLCSKELREDALSFELKGVF